MKMNVVLLGKGVLAGRIADWLYENEQYQYMTLHANALLFLACAYDADDDTDRRKRLGKLLEKGVKFAAENQTTRGGWGSVSPRENGDYDESLATTQVLQGLFAVRKVGLDVPKKTTDRGIDYLVKSTNRDGGVCTRLPTRLREARADGCAVADADPQPRVSSAR